MSNLEEERISIVIEDVSEESKSRKNSPDPNKPAKQSAQRRKSPELTLSTSAVKSNRLRNNKVKLAETEDARK